MMHAIKVYRERFQPSAQLGKPYVMLGCNVCAAETNEEAQWLRSSAQQSTLNLRRGRPGRLPPPVKDLENQISADERMMLQELQTASMVGSAETVHQQLEAFIEHTGADELIISAQIYEHQARKRSYEITAELAISQVA